MNTERKQFLCKLIPPRPTFASDMTEIEGMVIVFGPVLDPKGTWGVAIVEVANEQDARILGKNDPAVKDIGLTFEVYSMPSAIVRQ